GACVAASDAAILVEREASAPPWPHLRGRSRLSVGNYAAGNMRAAMASTAGTRQPRIVVFAPAPLLTITIEQKGDEPDVHLHAGGQGFWLARMMASLGSHVTLCGSFGGETGAVLRTLIAAEGVDVRGVDMAGGNVAYVHDRRSGEGRVVAEMRPVPLSRHETDGLYTTTLAESLEADAVALGGPPAEDVVPAD